MPGPIEGSVCFRDSMACKGANSGGLWGALLLRLRDVADGFRQSCSQETIVVPLIQTAWATWSTGHNFASSFRQPTSKSNTNVALL